MSELDGTSQPDQVAARSANRIYGLLVVGAALATAATGTKNRWNVFLDAFVVAMVYSLAHMYAHLVEERSRRSTPLSSHEVRAIATNAFSILQATGLPFVALVLTKVIGVGAATSVTIAMWVLVGELTVTSWLASSQIRPWWRRGAYATGATALGLLLILLKIVTH
ncbi:MAG TPA: hypothetical protein VIK61_00340 [Acidimicrobiia bacterium]